MDAFLINIVLAGMLVVARISGFFAMVPVFGATNIPNRVKLGLALTLSIIMLTLHGQTAMQHPIATDFWQLAAMIGMEFLVGLLLGFAAELMVNSLRLAGEMASMQMGISISGVLDPVAGIQTPIIGQAYVMFAMMLMLILNVHHHLLWALDRTYYWLPLGKVVLGHGGLMPGILAARFLALTSDMLALGLLVAAPTMGVLFVTEIAIAFVAKVMPQMNVFTVSIPLKCALGILLIAVSFPNVAQLLERQDATLVRQLMLLFSHSP
ncbi:MAG: flagellar biosynthetic protein FliR [Vampirovibrionales bacterium]|nr:flagellar biosynthetic protein FliR [Vampirovibrionales bacterium]